MTFKYNVLLNVKFFNTGFAKAVKNRSVLVNDFTCYACINNVLFYSG